MATTKKVNPMPYVGLERSILYTVLNDSADSYEAGEILEFEKGSISTSFEVGAETTPFFADNVTKINDVTYTPTASFGYAGDNADIDVMLYGKVKKGGAVLDNFGAVPVCGLIIVLNQGGGEFCVRQYLKFTATKDGTEVTTKSGTTTFTTPSATINPLHCTYFNSYTREFYSTDEAIAGMTAEQVVTALMEDVSHEFTTSQEA